MKATVKLFFKKSKNPTKRLKINGALSVSTALASLIPLIGETKATRAEIVITIPRRRSS